MPTVLTPNIKAVKGVSDDYDELIESLEDFERHLNSLPQLPEISPASEETLVEIMIELLKMLGETMRVIKQGQFSESALNDTPYLA